MPPIRPQSTHAQRRASQHPGSRPPIPGQGEKKHAPPPPPPPSKPSASLAAPISRVGLPLPGSAFRSTVNGDRLRITTATTPPASINTRRHVPALNTAAAAGRRPAPLAKPTAALGKVGTTQSSRQVSAAGAAVSASNNKKLEKRLESAIEFVKNLLTLLSAGDLSDLPETDKLVEEMFGHIEKLHLSCQQRGKELSIQIFNEADNVGTKLWNLCTRLRREISVENGGNQKRLRRVYLFGRGLGFLLVGVVRGDRGRGEVAGVVKLGLKVVRGCIEEKETKLAGIVVQVVADHKGVLQGLQDEGGGLDEEEIKERNCLEMEYFILRTALAWVENRLDVAEHMFAKAERLRQYLTRDFAEKLADVLYEIGKSLYGKGDCAIAVKWLDRANEIINGQELEQLSREGIELRLAVLQSLVTACLGTGTEEGLVKGRNIVDFLEGEMGNKLVVSLLKLELLQHTPAEVFDGESYADVLRHIIRNFNSSESEFRLIMHHIRKLHDKSPRTGGGILDDFIIMLRGPDKSQWMEKAVITRIWMITNQRDSTGIITAVQGVLGHLSKPLGAEAAVAAQALVWKKIESNYSQGQHDLAESWCQLALHKVFEQCGALNTAKLERKLILCALARNNMDGAISVLQSMSPSSWNEPMTAYLAFKVAIRTEDRDLAEKCLQAISLTPDHVDFLGACIAESQKAGDITCALAALKILQKKYEHKSPNPVHLPALFRCTVRLLNLIGTRPDVDATTVVTELCETFENVVVALDHHNKSDMGRTPFTVDELEWFSRNAYNLALKNTTVWELPFIVRMLTACVNIINHFPSDVENQLELALKSLFSRFIVASALISLARTQDSVETQLEQYATMREHVMAFDGELPELLPKLDGHSRDDLVRKNATLLTFDFEAAIALHRWDDLGGIVQRTVPCKSITAFQAMADCLLRARAPGQTLYSTMRKLVNEIWVLERFDALRLAKYTRCLFQATLPLDDGLAMRLLDEACEKAKELREGEAHWPEEELEWMAATAFNHAIDCFSAQDTERGRGWAARAINLAHYRDDGRLEEVLQAKYLRLGIDGA